MRSHDRTRYRYASEAPYPRFTGEAGPADGNGSCAPAVRRGPHGDLRVRSRRRLYDWREWAEALVPLVVTAPVGLLLWYFGGSRGS
ncbi:hypothetical protein [Streptomyces sp. ITFR-16]|uniref:hypothetical protein n=1 Tax=Streptomyces sp. ITFR-16 TaxID=3075198 RepID=UPI0028890F96|nr:hypothetical protein [Streptomyces sp. ITFR-16]WNI23853.1 hypothetical protein RLT58_18890 [Streptomyces sp. ITFR-16]